jgi:hypothetical protein
MPLTPANPVAWGAPPDAVERLDMRGLRRKVFRLPPQAGDPPWLERHLAVFADGLLHYRTDDDELDDLDTTLEDDPQTGEVVARRLPYLVRLTDQGIVVVQRRSLKGVRWNLPARPTVNPDRSSCSLNFLGLTWTWEIRPSGIKAYAPVAASRGPRNYSFPYTLLPGTAPFSVDANGNLVGDGFVIPRARAYGANGQVYPCGPWELLTSPARARFQFDDTTLPAAAYPYRLDPTTTFDVTTGSDDGACSRLGGVWPLTTSTQVDTASVTINVDKSNSPDGNGNNSYSVTVGLVRFDTSSLGASSTITSATLRLFITARQSSNSRSVNVEYYANSNWPIDAADWTDTASATAHGATTIAALTLNADNDFALSSPDANINKTGYTGFRLHVSGGVPGGGNSYTFRSRDHATTTTRPRLLVVYTTGSIGSADGAGSASALLGLAGPAAGTGSASTSIGLVSTVAGQAGLDARFGLAAIVAGQGLLEPFAPPEMWRLLGVGAVTLWITRAVDLVLMTSFPALMQVTAVVPTHSVSLSATGTTAALSGVGPETAMATQPALTLRLTVLLGGADVSHTTTTQYVLGAQPDIKAVFTAEDGSPATVTSPTCLVVDPEGVRITYSGGSVSNPTAGEYRVSLTLNKLGTWKVRFTGTYSGKAITQQIELEVVGASFS